MIKNPLISVIIPVYNAERYLSQCLDTVINQTLKDIEIICVDDGSTDKSLEILKTYQKRDNRIVVLQQENKHAGIARNTGLKIAKGKYLSFLDSDDWFELTMLEEMYNQAEKDQSDVVVCEYFVYDDNLKKELFVFNIEKDFQNLSSFSFKDMPHKLNGICNSNPWTKLFKRELFIQNQLQFNDSICFNDYSCVITALAIANKISILKKPLIHYRSVQKYNLTNTVTSTHRMDALLSSMQSLYLNFQRLNIYNLYKNWFIKKTRNAFKNYKNNEYDKIKKANLPAEIFDMIYAQPLVSIIIPTYNTKPEYLDECINSLLNQTYKNIEIIIIDDKSDKYDYDYITMKSPKIKLVKNEINLGCSKNVQKGFKLATGEYIVKVDSDDYIDTTMISKEVEILENNTNIGAVCCELQRFGKQTYLIKRPQKWSLDFALFVDKGNTCGYAGGMMFKSELLHDIDIDTQFRVCEDFDFHLQILEITNIYSIHEVLYYYRSHDSNTMITARNGERKNIMKKIIDKHKSIYYKNIARNTRKKRNKYF